MRGEVDRHRTLVRMHERAKRQRELKRKEEEEEEEEAADREIIYPLRSLCSCPSIEC